MLTDCEVRGVSFDDAVELWETLQLGEAPPESLEPKPTPLRTRNVSSMMRGTGRVGPSPVALLAPDTVSNSPAIGMGGEDTDVPSLDVE